MDYLEYNDELGCASEFESELAEKQDQEDQVYVMMVFLSQGHTIKEWYALQDDPDAYIEFLEALLA